MTRRIVEKMVATLLVTILMFTYAATIGIYAQAVYANENSLEVQGIKTNNENVQFDAYFVKDNKKVHQTLNQINAQNSIYVSIAVKNAGYLKNAKIQFTGNEENGQANFKLAQMQEQNKAITNIDTNANTANINQINKNQQINVAIPIQFDIKDTISLAQFSQENKAKLEGTYIDEKGKEKQIKAEIIVKVEWTEIPEIILEQQLVKYIPYTSNGKTEIMLQTIVKSSIANNKLPVKQTNIEIIAPIISNVKPKVVKVVANSTKATNGDKNGINFTREQYNYDLEQGKVNIKIENNQDENGNVTWEKQAQDEFIVTYLYTEEALKNIMQEGSNIAITTNANITTYGIQEKLTSKSITGEATLKDQIGQMVEFKVESNVEELSKGYIYANYQAAEKLETEYEEKISANIGLCDVTDSIILTSNVDNFVIDENTKGAATEYTKQIKIEKEIFNKFLGEEGQIDIYAASNIISSINKETEVDEEGNITVDVSEFNASEITIQTTKPLTEGTIEITVTKALRGDIQYNKSQMRSFSSLEIVSTGKAMNNAVAFNEQVVKKSILLTEPTSKAELTINNTNLSTVVTNENVEIKAILKTNSLDCNLYTNPTITITMPSYIESINVKNVQVLFDEELKIKAANLMQNADGTKSIVLQLEGTQTKYNIGNIAGGTNIIITADITVNKLTPNTDAEIKMNYTNENVIQAINTRMLRSVSAQVEQNEIATAVSFVAPTGIVTMNGIAGYKDGAEELTSISGEEKIGEIEIMSAAREATFNMSVMNNYNNTIENIVVLGRTPFKGNKTIETAKDLGSTMDLNLTTPITVAGVDSTKVTIYYSENGEATKDLTNTANGWTTAPSNLATVKSYLIVINNHVMNKAETITFSYNAQIPANLQHNQSSFETYAVYFQNNLEAGKVQDKQETAKVGVTTGKGPVLEAQITSNVAEDEQYVLSGKFIKYSISVKNTGDIEAKNIVAKVNIPENTTYIEFTDFEQGIYVSNYYVDEINIEMGNIEEGKTAIKEFWVIVDAISVNEICQDETHYILTEDGPQGHSVQITHKPNEYQKQISTKAIIIADDLDKAIETNEINIDIRNAVFNTESELDIDTADYLKEGDELQYMIDIYSSYTVEDTILETHIPTELQYIKVTEEREKTNFTSKEIDSNRIKYNEQTGKLQVNLEKIENTRVTICIVTKVKEIKEECYSNEILLQSYMMGKDIQTEKTEILKANVSKNALKITQSCNIPENTAVSDGEELCYKINIESLGIKTEQNIEINFIDKLPEELVFLKATKIADDGSESNIVGSYLTDDNQLEFSVEILEGVSKQINIYAQVLAEEEDREITNKIKAYTEQIDNIEVNSISHTIEAIDYENIELEDETKRKINGQVWLDENKDGIKEVEEMKIGNIEVMLLNAQTGQLVRDDNGEIIKETTSEQGMYTFKNILQGQYTVIFLYDTVNYSSTSYRKGGVDETKNSDAIDTQITLDGKNKIVAITEEIIVSDSNIYNLDLGLVVNPKFDLKLDKTVSSITVQNATGTKAYNYEDSKLAKRDLVGKEISSTIIVVEYKIKVTNEGAISGYVKKIVDYMPEELKFTSELNKDWYQGENGEIYNSSLSNTIINPGETKEVTLLLTQKLTDENIGLIQNTAEIYEAYNDLGLKDVDSMEANKVSGEDDQSSADILLTVKTGETIIFIGLAIAIISSIAIGVYIVKKRF